MVEVEAETTIIEDGEGEAGTFIQALIALINGGNYLQMIASVSLKDKPNQQSNNKA